MSTLPILRELQATLDLLRTIERDLAAFPPDLAQVDTQLKASEKRGAEIAKALEEGRAKAEGLRREAAAIKAEEDAARAHLKAAHEKVQYAHAIREIEEKERARHTVEKPLKELEAKLAGLEAEAAANAAKGAELKEQFELLHGAFLEGHGNQVAGREQLTVKRAELEGQLPPVELGRFNRLLQQRHGKAVVAVENGTCLGCRTKLRGPFLSQLRETKQPVACESCQRILFLP